MVKFRMRFLSSVPYRERERERERVNCGQQKGLPVKGSPFCYIYNTGDDLLSHTASGAVSSALKVFTSVFGMGTGVTPSLQPPVNFNSF